ncbi:MAG: HAMP domain-containing histidine kinase [Lachnospiraceae bacterium]|jgi:two-component system phosphate regulon sensor histidine kinase PhoR|nr:HAMP domain-containing histidine kinase [Lachnospiraceae bacterium]
MRARTAAGAWLAALVLLLTGGIVFANSFHMEIADGGHVTAEQLETQVFRIAKTGLRLEEGHAVLEVRIEGEPDFGKIWLAAFRTKSMIFYDEEGGAHEVLSLGGYQHVRLLPIAFYTYDEQSGILRLEWSGADFFNPYYLFIGSRQILEAQNTFWNRVKDMAVGIMLLMLLYSLSLYVHKKEESYLLSFSAYIGVALLMTVLNMGPMQSEWLNRVYSELIPFLIMTILCMEVSTCISLLEPELCWWMRGFCSWKWVMAVSLGYSLISHMDIMLLNEASRFLVILAGFLVVTKACARKKEKAYILFLGYVISESINLVPFGVNLGFFEDGLLLAFFRVARLYGLPFAFSCMLYINWKLAGRFREAERLSAELEETNRSLDRIVGERTRACMAQMEKRHSLMLNIFHDLRSPLFTLKGCMQILCDENEADREERREIESIVMEKLDFVSQLTENIFLLAKLEDESFLFASTRVDMVSLLRKMAAAARIAAQSKELRITEEIPDGEIYVWGDKNRLEQAVDNILSNAIRYTPKGGRITVGLKQTKACVTLRIKDTGIGIPEEQQKDIFARYYRASSTSKDSTGLGLAIARGLIRKHGGEITVKSAAGRGAEFSVTLPALSQREPEERPEQGGRR